MQRQEGDLDHAYRVFVEYRVGRPRILSKPARSALGCSRENVANTKRDEQRELLGELHEG